jgi:2-methylcitrate dehydratase PrpD
MQAAPMDPIEEKLVRFTDSFGFDDIEAPVLHAIKLRFIDTIGCALAGYNEGPARIARKLARQVR